MGKTFIKYVIIIILLIFLTYVNDTEIHSENYIEILSYLLQ